MTRIEITITGDVPDDEDPEEFAERVSTWAVPTVGTQVLSARIEDVRVLEDS